MTVTPLVTLMAPGFTTPVPPVKTAVSVVEVPEVIVDAPELKLVIAGAATTPKVKLCCALGSVPLLAVMVIE